MKNKPLVSIIVPVYNTELFLDRCVKSIINQSYSNIEVLLIDDGSTDSSPERCDEYGKNDSRIIVIHQTNKGLSGARNVGIKKCRGDYITFVDSDDDIEKDYVKYLVNLIWPNNDMTICAHNEIKNGKIIRNFGNGKQQAQLNAEQCLALMMNEDGFMVSAWGKLYKRELFADIEFPLNVLHEDICTTYKLILKSNNIQYGPSPKYNYRQNCNSITNSGFDERKKNILSSTDKMCSSIEYRFPELADICLGRRVQARFSVLRLILHNKSISKKYERETKRIEKFIFDNRKAVLKSKQIPARTKLAVITLLLGETCFKYSWKIYTILFK